MKASYLNGEVNMHSFPQQGTLVNYFDKYYHTTIELTDGKILYCYFSLNLSPSSTGATSQELRLKVFYQSPNDIFNDIPAFNLPTSPSSTLPSKIILFKSATVAIVVPGLNVLASIA